MRHETIDQPHQVDALDVAAVWPSTTQLAPLPVAELQAANEARPQPEEAVPDMPAAAGLFMVLAYGALLAMLAIATTGSGKSLLMIVISGFFMAMFFAVPAVFLGVSTDPTRRPSLARFLEKGVQTLTGHSSGSAALVQMLVVPVCLALGMICIAIAAAVIR